MSDSTAPKSVDRTQERIRARQKGKPATRAAERSVTEENEGVGRWARGWIDALFFAFLLAMFIRTFVFELFMIPTGSMTPTLIGDDARQISEFDWDRDGDEDVVALPGMARNTDVNRLQVHLRNDDGVFDEMLFLANPSPETRRTFRDFRGLTPGSEANKGAGRRDMIMVNKFSYWFREPDRGDILVFKTPDRPDLVSRGAPNGHPFDPSKPVFIKRVVGLPNEEVALRTPGRFFSRETGDPQRLSPDGYGGTEYVPIHRPVLINGEPLTGDPFDRLHHFPPSGGLSDLADEKIQEISTGSSGVLMLGDNQMSSLDSRYWGPVPLNHLRGKAVLRYLPLRAFGFLQN